MNDIEIEIALRKTNAKSKASKCYDLALTYNEFREIERAYKNLTQDIITGSFSTYNQIDVTQLQEKLPYLLNQRNEVAKKYGIDVRAFSPEYHYTCKICGDTGYVQGKKCKCYKKLFNQQMLKNFDKPFPTLKDFDINLFEEKTQGQNLFNLCEKFVEKFPEVPKTLTMQGTVGAGKSHFAQTITAELIQRDFIVCYFPASEFVKKLRDWHFAPLGDKEIYENLFMECDLLIIDDLGTEPIYNNINFEYMQNILDQRQYQGLHTMLITNLVPDQFINIYGERLFSRIFYGKDTKTYQLNGADLRRRSKELCNKNK